MNSLTWEKYRPLLLSVVAAALWYRYGVSFPGELPTFLSASLSFSAILVGFVVMMQTVIVTISSSAILKEIKGSGYLKDLNGYIRSATYSLLLFSSANLAGFFMSENKMWFEMAWVFLGVYSIAAFIRMTGIVSKIMMSV